MLSWGANSYGQLGQGHKEDMLQPKQLSFEHCTDKIICITGGGGHTCVVTGCGSVWSCGLNEKGQLGTDHEMDSTKLQKITALDAVKIGKIACGWDFTIAATCDGQLFAWGSNNYGQLGHLEYKNYVRPVPVESCLGKHVSDVSAGLRHSAVICNKEVWCFGSNKKGQVGNGTLLDKTSNVVSAPSGEEFVGVRCGALHTLALTASGTLFGWGSNNKGQLATSPKDTRYSTVPHVLPINNVKQVHSGWTHVIVINAQGQLQSWGRGDYGQLGRECPAIGYCHTPQLCLLSACVTKVTGGAEHNIALTSDNTVWSWGWNEHGMCGNGHTENLSYPTAVSLPEHTRAYLTGCGSGHTFVAVTT